MVWLIRILIFIAGCVFGGWFYKRMILATLKDIESGTIKDIQNRKIKREKND